MRANLLWCKWLETRLFGRNFQKAFNKKRFLMAYFWHIENYAVICLKINRLKPKELG